MSSPTAISNNIHFTTETLTPTPRGKQIMQFFETYKNENPTFSADTFECAKQTVDKLLATETPTDRPGMLLGKVQSGKTRTYVAITANAFDRGFGAVIVLTKNSKALPSHLGRLVELNCEILRNEPDRSRLFSNTQLPPEGL